MAIGYARSEACGTMLVQMPEESTLNVHGTAVNQDGRHASFMAPCGPAQQMVVRTALRTLSLNIVESHGTGTALGDPVEVGALRQALHNSVAGDGLIIGARKSQMAHHCSTCAIFINPAKLQIGFRLAVVHFRSREKSA